MHQPRPTFLLVLPLLAASLVLGLSPAAAQEAAAVKVAVIDSSRLLTDSVAGKAAIARLDEQRDKTQAQLDERVERVRGLREKISQGQLSLSEESLADLRQQLEEESIALERTRDDAAREFQKAQANEFKKIEEAVAPIIKQVGQDLGMTLIFNKFESGLVYADDSVDITDVVIQRFDAAQAAGGS